MFYVYHIFFIQSTTGHLGWLHVLAILNSAALNVHVYVSLKKNNLYSFGYTPSNGIAGLNVFLIIGVEELPHFVYYFEVCSLNA